MMATREIKMWSKFLYPFDYANDISAFNVVLESTYVQILLKLYFLNEMNENKKKLLELAQKT